MEEEFGDLLFSLINFARFKKINPDEALERTNKKFIYRFQYLEEAAKKSGKNLSDMTLEAVSYTHLRAHETVLDLVCRLLLETKKKTKKTSD